METKVKYVITRREPHGEVIDTYIMACADTSADAEEFILGLAEDYAYTAFCGAIHIDEMEVKDAFIMAQDAEAYYIDQCVIFPVVQV